MERNGRRSTRLSASARRLTSLAVLCTASIWSFAAEVARADALPSNTGEIPAISGTAQQDAVLTATPGGWTGQQPITFTYLWSDGTIGSTDPLSAADVGQSLTVTVTASNDFGQTQATSDSYGPVLPAPPVPGDPPVIDGTPQQGHTLTVRNGTWSNDPTSFGYVWENCDSTGSNCTAISGASSNSYTPQASDVGDTIVAQVTASNAGGHTPATSASVGPVLPPAPQIGTTPAITGTAQQGVTLSVSSGTWSNDPTGFAYVWEDCDSSGNNCSPITGATSSSYTLQPSDVGSTVAAQVTASNAGGQSSATSGRVGPVLPAAPAPGDPPVISGTAQQGKTLSVSNGTWGNNPTGFAYVWEECDGSGNNCSPITGATSSTYTLKASNVNSTIVASVKASNTGGQNSATSASVGPVLPAAPTVGANPVITGTAQQGNTLSVSNGTWTNSPADFGYVWEDCNSSGNCAAIAGAKSRGYVLQASDVGSKIVAVVTASNAGGQNSSPSSATAPVLPAAPAIGTAPGISGTAQQGRTLTVSNGTWSNNPTAFTYAWQDCGTSGNACSPIAGATSSTYLLSASMVGRYVSVTVTASNSGGRTSVTTATVGRVLPPPPANTQAPTISKVGGTLSVSNGNWSNNPTGFSYAWESCSASGANCNPIGGATSSSYALSAADIGSTIFGVVTATGAGGSASASTAKTAIVSASDIPAASQPTTTELLATPSAPVTNQNVTLIATVTAGTSSTALWGTVTFANGGTAIPGCSSMPAAPSGRSATVACSTSFAASTAHLTAVFNPASGSILKGSGSPNANLTVGPDSSSTSLAASPSVSVGASTTYTAAVAAPAARPGPLQPTGWVEFLDGGQPIGSCAGQSLADGAATCTVSYAAAGAHQITALYSGDGNFTGSGSSADQVTAVPVPASVLGTITATMQWAFYYTPKYTMVRNLVVNGASPGARVVVKCQGRGCPFASHSTFVTKGKRCGRTAKRSCPTPGTLDVTASFFGRHLAVGTRITVSVIRPGWVGKSYRFTVRARRGPRVQIGSLPVALTPGSAAALAGIG